MTRKHFEALAAALKASKPISDPHSEDSIEANALAQWRADVQAVASVCLAHNPRFDTRFYEACGYEITTTPAS